MLQDEIDTDPEDGPSGQATQRAVSAGEASIFTISTVEEDGEEGDVMPTPTGKRALALDGEGEDESGRKAKRPKSRGGGDAGLLALTPAGGGREGGKGKQEQGGGCVGEGVVTCETTAGFAVLSG